MAHWFFHAPFLILTFNSPRPYSSLVAMKFLAVFGLVGTLCTFGIIAWMMGKTADKLTPVLNDAQGSNDPNNGHTLPKPVGAEINLKAIHTAMFAYQLSKNSYPHPNQLDTPPNYSNDVLRLLFKSGHVRDEKNFAFLNSIVATQQPDERTQGNQALGPGENHWAYVVPPKHFNRYQNIPVLIEPYRPGETSYRASDYGTGRGVLVLFSDGSIRTIPINSKGEPVIKKQNILSSDYYGWRGDTPTVLQPEGE